MKLFYYLLYFFSRFGVYGKRDRWNFSYMRTRAFLGMFQFAFLCIIAAWWKVITGIDEFFHLSKWILAIIALAISFLTYFEVGPAFYEKNKQFNLLTVEKRFTYDLLAVIFLILFIVFTFYSILLARKA